MGIGRDGRGGQQDIVVQGDESRGLHRLLHERAKDAADRSALGRGAHRAHARARNRRTRPLDEEQLARARLNRRSRGAARREGARRELREARGRALEPRGERRRVDRDAEMHLDPQRDALGNDQRRHGAHVLIEADPQLGNRRGPARELQRCQEALERIELHVEVEGAGARLVLTKRIADLEEVLADPGVTKGPLVRYGRLRPRRDDGANQVARGVAELRFLGGAHLFFLDDARQELALEPGPRKRAAGGCFVREGIGEGGDLLGRLVESPRARSKGEEVERAVVDDGRRVLGEDGVGPDPLERVVGRARRSARARGQAGIGGCDPAHRLVLDPAEPGDPLRVVRRGDGRRVRCARDGSRARCREKRDPRRGPARGRSRRHHSPITLTIRRLSRWPSNSA